MTDSFDSSTTPVEAVPQRLTAFLDTYVGPVVISPSGDESVTQASVQVRQVGAALLIHLRSRGLCMSRPPERRGGPLREPTVSVTLLERGIARCTSAGWQGELAAGQIIIGHPGLARTLSWSGEIEASSLVVWAGALGLAGGHRELTSPVLQSNPASMLLRNHLSQLWTATNVVGGAAATMLTAAAGDLARAAVQASTSAETDPNGVRAEALAAGVAAYVHQHLADKSLSLEQIARAQGISLRQLHKSWASQPMTLSQWILRQRLEASRRQLARADVPPPTVASVARRWGFADPTHFSRRFREAYGMSPSQWHQHNQSPERPRMP